MIVESPLLQCKLLKIRFFEDPGRLHNYKRDFTVEQHGEIL